MSQKTMELYIHIPFCVKKCQYCDFLSFAADEATQAAYVEALLREIAYYGPHCSDYLVSTVYIGGGTPSWLTEEWMAQIMSAVRRSFRLASDAEISIECNPGTVTDHKFAGYRNAGINRISIGLQSAVDEELKILGRIHTFDQFLKTYELARKNGFDNVNVDIMSSLPGQTAESFARTLQQLLWLKPEHISAYSLIIEKGTPFYDLYKFDAVKQQAGMQTVALPTEDEVYRMTKLTEQVLAEAGYVHYEVSNFAKPGYACRHNIGYWERENYLGLGLGAASLLGKERFSNTSDMQEYLKNSSAPEKIRKNRELLTREDEMAEFMFLGLRMTQGVSKKEFQEYFGTAIENIYGEVLKKYKKQGLLLEESGRIFLSREGVHVSNAVMADFLL